MLTFGHNGIRMSAVHRATAFFLCSNLVLFLEVYKPSSKVFPDATLGVRYCLTDKGCSDCDTFQVTQEHAMRLPEGLKRRKLANGLRKTKYRSRSRVALCVENCGCEQQSSLYRFVVLPCIHLTLKPDAAPCYSRYGTMKGT